MLLNLSQGKLTLLQILTLISGWLPFCIGVLCTVIMVIWEWGSSTLRKINKDDVVLNFEDFHKQNECLKRVKGVGVFFVNSSVGVPRYLTKFTKTLTVLPEIIVFVSIKYYRVPFVSEKHRISSYMLHENVFRIVARYGFFEKKVVLPQLIALAVKKYNFQIPSTLALSSDTHHDNVIISQNDVMIGTTEDSQVEQKSIQEPISSPQVDSQADSFNGSSIPQVDTPSSQVSREPQKDTPHHPIVNLCKRLYAYLFLRTTDDDEYIADTLDINFFLPRDTIMVNKHRWFFWRYPAQVFVFMLRNSRNETRRLQISAERVFEVGNVVYL
jgi:K+ transporter